VIARREKPPVGVVSLSILFNGAQLYLSALAAGAVLLIGGVSARGGITRPVDVLVIAAAAVAFYSVNTSLVATAVALATSRHPLAVVRSGQKVVVAPLAGLYVIGAMSAFAAVRWPWLPALAVVGAVLSYHTLRRRIEMRHESMRALERMAYEVDRRDPYTFQHSQRVAIYAHAIGRKLGLSPAEIEMVQLAAKVHDIGKIRIPDSILLKPARLTEKERRVMETHPRLGFDILRPFGEYANVLDLVLTHHERYDGLGYPNGTMGRRLLLMAQVIPVADSLDAMTTARAYRPARSWESAIEELRRGAGTQWNPRVVEAAVVALRQEAPARSSRPRAVPA
jgi:putative nucleotidyltransferase with HDIG domain